MSYETVKLTDTLNLIDVRGSNSETLLLARDQPIAMNWDDCSGTVAQYLIRAGVPNFDAEMADLRHTLDGHLNPNAPLADQLRLFLQLLASGVYRLATYEAELYELIEADTPWDLEQDYGHFYPYETPLVMTQPTSSLNPATIERYIALIQAGQRPIALAVTAEEAWCDYVIDGHHKLIAYKTLKVNPTVITACRELPPPVPDDTFPRCFPATHPLASHYAKEKAR